MPQAVLGLGSNLGARRALFACARELTAAEPRLTLLASSPLYHTPPLGPPQPDYLNAALLVDWQGEARELLAHTQRIELLLRRQRNQRWGARTLDIDLLHWSEGALAEEGLTIPHPGLCERAFALAPLLDVLPALAAELAPQLAALGGSPEVSEPFVPLFAVVRPGELLTAALAEPPELVSAFGAALCASLENTALARAVRPFLVASSPLERTLEELEQALRDVCAAGFAARQLAVTDVSEDTLAGIIVGSEICAPRPLPELRFALEKGQLAPSVRVWLAGQSALWP